MNIIKKIISLTLTILLLSTSVYAADIKASYDGSKLYLKGTLYPQTTVALTVIPKGSTHSINSQYALIKEINPQNDGSFEFASALYPSLKSGYYTAIAYTSETSEVKQDFFFVNPAYANPALNSIGKEAITKYDLISNSAAFGISSDLDDPRIDMDRLIERINVLKNGKTIDTNDFIRIYLSSLLTGGMNFAHDDYKSLILNNSFFINLIGHDFFTLSDGEQAKLISDVKKYKQSSLNLADTLRETSFLNEINISDISKTSFENTVLVKYVSFLKLNTEKYDKLKFPENVITALMSETYQSAKHFKDAFERESKKQYDIDYPASSLPYQPATGGGGAMGGSNSVSDSASYDDTITEPQRPVDDSFLSDTVDFFDMRNHWSATAVNYLRARGIVNGVGNNEFAPEKAVTRAEFAKMISEALYKYESTPNIVFSDVQPGDWYASSISKLYARNIVTGMGNNCFEPNGTITRQDAAVIIQRAASYSNINLSAKRNKMDFDDDESIADYAKSAIEVLYMAELLNGVSQSSFAPLMGVTRAQAAQMIYNLLIKEAKIA